MVKELDALGDELVADTDTSYLDSVSVPSGPPKETDKEVSRFFFNNLIIYFSQLLLFFTKDGQLVDEFGLPKILAS